MGIFLVVVTGAANMWLDGKGPVQARNKHRSTEVRGRSSGAVLRKALSCLCGLSQQDVTVSVSRFQGIEVEVKGVGFSEHGARLCFLSSFCPDFQTYPFRGVEFQLLRRGCIL